MIEKLREAIKSNSPILLNGVSIPRNEYMKKVSFAQITYRFNPNDIESKTIYEKLYNNLPDYEKEFLTF